MGFEIELKGGERYNFFKGVMATFYGSNFEEGLFYMKYTDDKGKNEVVMYKYKRLEDDGSEDFIDKATECLIDDLVKDNWYRVAYAEYLIHLRYFINNALISMINDYVSYDTLMKEYLRVYEQINTWLISIDGVHDGVNPVVIEVIEDEHLPKYANHFGIHLYDHIVRV